MGKRIYPLPLPDYALDLLQAAKGLISGRGQNRLAYFRHLRHAVRRFEECMPVSPAGDVLAVHSQSCYELSDADVADMEVQAESEAEDAAETECDMCTVPCANSDECQKCLAGDKSWQNTRERR
jgi:hypothetical protein